MRIKRELLYYPAEIQPVSACPLLFIHGAWHGAWCWEPHFLPYFAGAGYHSYALSLSGHGGSWVDRSLRFIGIDDYVEDVARAAHELERLHGVSPVLIGHSMGGYVVQKFLETYTVPAAILLATIPSTGAGPFMLRVIRQHPLSYLRALFTMRAYPLIGTPALAHTYFFSTAMPRAEVADYHAQMQDESVLVSFQASLLKLPRPSRVNRVPLLVLAAADDRVFSVQEQERTARDYGADLIVIPELAHDVMLEHNWENAADALRGWLVHTL